MKKRFKYLLATLLLATLLPAVFFTVLGSIQAAPTTRPLLVFGNPITNPISNTHTAPRNSTISITYDEAISPTTVSTQTFAVHAMQTGLLAQTYGVNGGTISLTPSQAFKPGELVQVSATTGTLNLGGQGPISSTVWQFRTAVVGGSGIFTDSSQSLGGADTFGVALGDLDGDGALDAFVVNELSQPDEVWLNNGAGNFINSGQSLGTFDSQQVALGDLDGDGDLDAFVTTKQGSKVWLNEGSLQGGTLGNFTAGQNVNGVNNFSLALGDVDGDGDLDAIVGHSVTVYLNDGVGNFTDSSQSLGGGNNHSLALGDLNGDGDLDLFVGHSDGIPDKVWFNDGAGNFTDSGQSLSSSPTRVALGDLDGDGDLDAFVAHGGQPDKVWRNNGAGFFTDTGQNLGSSVGLAVALGDVDGDGDLDAFVGNRGFPPVITDANKVWLNDGTGNFTDTVQSLGNSASTSVVLGDLDGDGDLDAFIGNQNPGGANAVWLNQNFLYLPIVF
jgi:hypothetical protein